MLRAPDCQPMRSAISAPMASDPVEYQLRKFLTQRLSCTSLIGFVKSIDTGDAGKVRHRFAVPGKA